MESVGNIKALIGARQPSVPRPRSCWPLVQQVRDVKAGEVLTADNVRAIRPGHGLPTRHLDEVLGRAVKADVPRGTALTWEILR